MAGNALGKYYVEIVPSTGGIGKSIESELNGSDAGKKFSSSLLDSIKSTAIGTAIGGLVSSGLQTAANAAKEMFGQAFQGAADFQQNVGGIQKLYGNMGMSVEEYAKSMGKSVGDVQGDWSKLEKAQNDVLKNAQNAYKTTGMSANQYMETATGFSASLINSLNGDTQKAAELTDVAMKSISDNWNTFGGDMDMVTQAYQGFAKQNYTMLDNLKLGYGGTKTEMERLIADANEWGAANGKASNLSIDSFADVVTAIDYIQRKQQIAGTTAHEASSTISGSLGMLSASWSNWLTELGNGQGDMMARTSELVKSLSVALSNVIPLIGQMVVGAIQALPGLISGAFSAIGTAILPSIDSLTGGAGTRLVEGFRGIFDPIINQVLPVVQGAWAAFSGAIGNIAPVLSNIAGGAMQILTGAANALGWAFQTLQPVINFVAELFGGALKLALDVVSGIFTTLGEVITSVGEIVAPIAEAITQAFEDVAEQLSPIIDGIGGLIGGIGDFMADPLGAIGDFVTGGSKEMKKLEDNTKKSTENVKKDVSRNVSSAASSVKTQASAMNSSMQSGMSGMTSATSSGMSSVFSTTATKMNAVKNQVGSSMQQAAKDTKTNTQAMQTSIDSVKGKSVDLKANDLVSGIANTAKSKIAEVNGKTVELGAKKAGGFDSTVDKIKQTINGIKGKNVDINLNVKQTGIRQLTIEQSFNGATGQTRYTVTRQNFAAGGILNRELSWLTAGEAGTEAIIPLSNRRYVRPFAQAVAAEIPGNGGGVTINIDKMTVRNDSDIDAISNRLYSQITRANGARL